MVRKRRRAPEVLRRSYGSRARSLADTVLSLLPSPPPPPAKCPCRGRGCLGCGGESFLLRCDDAAEYRKLLKQGFCVVAAHAPRLVDPNFDSHWSLDLIVRNTIELMMAESPKPENVLCRGYDKLCHSSPCGDLLSNSSWNLLLSRIGDQLMCFLLKSSSIFIPLSEKLHHQVSGPALDKILQDANQGSDQGRQVEPNSKLRKNVTSVPKDTGKANGIVGSDTPTRLVSCKNDMQADCHTNLSCHTTLIHSNSDDQETRCYYQQGDVMEKCISERNKSPCLEDSFSGNRSAIDGSCLEVSMKQCLEKRNTVATSFDALCSPMNACFSGGVISNRRNLVALYTEKRLWNERRLNKSQQNGLHKRRRLNHSQQDVLKSQNFEKMSCRAKFNRKRLWSVRQFSERVKALESGVHDGFSCLDPEHPMKRGKSIDWQNQVKHRKKDHLGGIFVGNFHKNEESLPGNCRAIAGQVTSKCFSCLVLQAESTVSIKKEITRKSMFHNSLPVHPTFPRNHLLSRLKPNISGARNLLKVIFGISEGLSSVHVLPCHMGRNSTCIYSGSLYHPLLRSLKVLIGNARRCQYLKLLNKHCLNPSSLRIRDNRSEERKHGLQDAIEDFFPQSCISENVDQMSNSDCKSKIRKSDSIFTPNGCYSRHHDVVAFVWAVCRSIIPVDLLGDARTWRPLRKNISKFIRARRFDKFSLEQCLHGIKMSSFIFSSYSLRCRCYHYNAKGEDSTSSVEIENFNSFQMDARKKLLRSWMYWLFSYIILPVVSSYFYVTEKEGEKQDVFYFPKPFWKGLVDKASSSLKEENYIFLDPTIVRKIVSKRPFGFSKVRFLPKEEGVRPLLNLKAPSKLDCLYKEFSLKMCSGKKGNSAKSCFRGRVSYFRPVNFALRDVHAIFKAIKVEHSQYLGASVFDYNDVYRRLCPFLSKLRKGSTRMPSLFIIVSDVSKAFDSINQDKLLGITKDFIKRDEYHIRRFAQVICTRKSSAAMYGPVACRENGSICINEPTSIRICSSRGILVDQGTTKRVKQEVLYHLLREHVKHNLVQLGDGIFLQKVGIPQGSLISTLLCSFYYGHMERNVILPFLDIVSKQLDCPLENIGSPNTGEQESITLKTSFQSYSLKDSDDSPVCTILTRDSGSEPVCSAGSGELLNDHFVRPCKANVPNENLSLPNILLMRFIDDFLFISTSADVARGFLDRLKRGFREYNCTMNSKKFATNLDMGNRSLLNRVYTGADGVSFIPWSGLLLNCQTLEIQADYTRYWDVHMKSTLSVLPCDKPGRHLEAKVCSYMRPKCHPIFYDSNINSPDIVALNAYQAFLICAMKFHCYVRALSLEGISLRPNYSADIIQRSFRYMHKLIKKRIYGMEDLGNIRPMFKLKKAELCCLGFFAYDRVLRKKLSRHVDLVSLLSSRLENFHYMVKRSSHIKFAVDDSHSSLLWRIKY